MMLVRAVVIFVWVAAVGLGHGLVAQEVKRASPFSRANSFGVFGEYSNDSSHILLGSAEQRKLLNFGASYSRRLASSHLADFNYLVEIRPVMIESDPLSRLTQTTVESFPGQPSSTFTYAQTFTQVLACRPDTFVVKGTIDLPGDPGTFTTTNVITCGGRKWTFGEGLSPVGIQAKFRPYHRLQPVFSGLGGYMFSTEPIPVSRAGSYNFTFEFGAGLELYRSPERSSSLFGNRSMRVEYRIHHISNHNTADQNPGIDNGTVQVTYSFGR